MSENTVKTFFEPQAYNKNVYQAAMLPRLSATAGDGHSQHRLTIWEPGF